MSTTSYVQTLHEKRLRAWEQAKEILDRCVAEKRERSAEENEMFERANADIVRLDAEIKTITEMEERAKAADIARAAYEPFIDPVVEDKRSLAQADLFARFLVTGEGGNRKDNGFIGVDVDLRGAMREHELVRRGYGEAELRALLSDTGSSGSLIPTDFSRTLYEYMVNESAVRQLAYVFTTAGGNNMDFPTVATHGIGTQVIAQGTAIGGTDPVFGKMTLGSFKFGQLVAVSSDFIQDSAVDVVDFVARNIGRALGIITATAYATGPGSTTGPNGVITAATGSVVTGGSLITTSFEDLINLQHSVATPYRRNGAYVVNDLTAGTLRKLREDAGGTTGQFLWQPAVALGMPDMICGKPIYTDTNIATHGSNAKVAAFGDFQSYYIRDAGSVRLERSDDYAFNVDNVTFRGVIRTDGDLIDVNAVKILKQNVS